MTVRIIRLITLSVVSTVLIGGLLSAQTRDKGPWWPSPHGAKDQAGNSNLITPDKIMKALRIPKTGQTYELGHIYEPGMPQYGNRPYYITVQPAPPPQKEGQGFAQSDYFNGYL